MNEKEKKEAIDAEVVEDGEKSEKKEKKENGFSKFFNKAKASVNNAVLESRLMIVPFLSYSTPSTIEVTLPSSVDVT